MKYQTKVGIGSVLLILPFVGNSWEYITDWSTPELVGYNLCPIALTLFGLFFLITGIIYSKKK